MVGLASTKGYFKVAKGLNFVVGLSQVSWTRELQWYFINDLHLKSSCKNLYPEIWKMTSRDTKYFFNSGE